ncbi:helix-turn-helix transcriptional regulator [Alkalicoccus luteus]|uniref:Helix-turn-helix transcriptional regulator n=1 Tax=Alkalicoccus luteus TaxID=1237094 RepID=A0A969PU46_9BACI|nr:helix-turn-helix transcriptional regulator [Alkalicoccus luteus]NJP37579.1 helix-turn-helix transcriptional regulator [Alkalicoccus luteus]
MRIDINMDQDIGRMVASRRIQTSVTQEELASGICSIPYLSKLENNKLTNPNPETVELLLERLDVDYDYFRRVQADSVRTIQKLYKSINNKRMKTAEKQWETLSQYAKEHPLLAVNADFLLIQFRYELFKWDMKAADKTKKRLDELSKTLSELQQFYFNYFIGLYASMNYNLVEGVRTMEHSLAIGKSLNIKDEFLFYHIALSYSLLGSSSLALFYAKEGLVIFQENLEQERVIDTFSLLGICYIRLRQYKQAEDIFDKVLDLSAEKESDSLLSMTFHNKGYLYSHKGDSELAIQYYEKSLKYQVEHSDKYFNTLFFMAKEYIKSNNIEKAKEVIDSDRERLNEPLSEIKLQMEMLRRKIGNNPESSVHYIEEIVFPFLETKPNSKLMTEACLQIGEAYEKLFKYKASSQFYKKAIDLYSDIELF